MATCTCPACLDLPAAHAPGCPAAGDLFASCSCGAQEAREAAIVAAHPWTEAQDADLRRADSEG